MKYVQNTKKQNEIDYKQNKYLTTIHSKVDYNLIGRCKKQNEDFTSC